MSAPSNRFIDIFHDFGDDEDEKEDEYVDFDRPNMYQDNEDDSGNMNRIGEDQQQLSQKLSQLSTEGTEQQGQQLTQATTTKKRLLPLQSPLTPTAAAATIITSKKIRMGNMEADQRELNIKMPKYLSANHQSFDRMIRPILIETGNVICMEELRQIALLQHKLALVDLKMKLWTTYLCSGTGRSIDQGQQTTVSRYATLTVWPEAVKLTMVEKEGTDPNGITDDNCLNYVQKVLRQLRDQTDYSHAQLDERKQYLHDSFTPEIEEAIVKFVEQQGIVGYRLRVEEQIVLVKYDYTDQLIESEFYQENPNTYQVRFSSNYYLSISTSIFFYCF